MVKLIIKSTKQLVELLEELMPFLKKLLEEVGGGYVQQFVRGVINKLSDAYNIISNWSWNDFVGYFDGTFETFTNAVSSVYETLTSFVTQHDWSSLAGYLWDAIGSIIEAIFNIIMVILGAG